MKPSPLPFGARVRQVMREERCSYREAAAILSARSVAARRAKAAHHQAREAYRRQQSDAA